MSRHVRPAEGRVSGHGSGDLHDDDDDAAMLCHVCDRLSLGHTASIWAFERVPWSGRAEERFYVLEERSSGDGFTSGFESRDGIPIGEEGGESVSLRLQVTGR